MKKYLLILFSLLCFSLGSVNAQTTVLTQNFDGGGLPASWARSGTSDCVAGYNVWANTSELASSGNTWCGGVCTAGRGGAGYCMFFYDWGTTNAVANYLLTPSNDLSSYSSSSLTFYYYNSGDADVINVYAKQGAAGTYSLVGGPYAQNGSAWTLVTINMNAWTGAGNNQIYIEFAGIGVCGASNIGIDDVLLTGSGSGCAVTITSNPANACVGTGGSHNFTVTATGATSYQWQVSTDGGVTWSNLSNAGNYSNVTTTTLSVNGVPGGFNGYQYRCACTNGCTSYSTGAVISVGVSGPSTPTANAASGISTTGFTAKWTAVAGASGYYLDVAYDNTFTNFLSGYNLLNVGNVTSTAISGLACGATYYYRVQAYNGCGTSARSNTITVTTSACPNNSCATAVSLGTPTGTCSSPWYSTSGSTGSGIASCSSGGSADDDIWFSFVCPASGSVTIDGMGSYNFDAVIELFSGTCGALTSIACADGGEYDCTESIYATSLTPGATYYVRIFNFDYGCGSGICSVCVTTGATAATTNDAASGAIALTNHDCYPQDTRSWVFYSTAGATNTGEPTTPACWTSTLANQTIWFKFTATTTAQLVTTDWWCTLLARGAADNRIAIYSSSNNLSTGTFTLIGCNEDIHNPTTTSSSVIYGWDNPMGIFGSYNDYQTALTVTGLTVGNTYFIRVDAPSGLVSICTSPAPTNDACSTAQAMTLNQLYSVNTNNSSPYSNLNISDLGFTTGTTQNMLFYTFTPAVTDLYYINQWSQVCELQLGTQFMLYNAGMNCSNLTQGINGTTPYANEFINSGSQSMAARSFSVTLTAGQTYYIVIDGAAGDECTFSFEITESVPASLPVELLDVNVACETNKPKISWTTATETNNDYFVVQRSKDAIHFSDVTTVKGAGTSSTPNYYTASDNTAEGTTNYYRIEQVDYNGATTFSKTIACYCKVKGFDVTAIVPVPSDDYVDVYYYIDKADNISFQLYDALGREVVKENDRAREGGNMHRVDLSSISKGIYYLTIKSSEDIYTGKIVKK